VARWPDWERDLLEHYLARNPAPEERLEYALANIATIYVSAHQGRAAPRPSLADFLLFKDAFTHTTSPAVDRGRYNEADMSLLEALGALRR
jgi:hypothetical protein